MNEEPEINLVPLAHFSNSIEAGMVRELLENNGIGAILQGVNFGGLEPLLMPGGYSEITLLVPEAELENAEQLRAAFFEQHSGEALPADVDVQEEVREKDDD